MPWAVDAAPGLLFWSHTYFIAKCHFWARRCAIRVLIVAPDQPGLNTRTEIRQIQRRHHASVLDGPVTAEEVYNVCRDTAFDIIHFASHSGPDGVLLSDGNLLTMEEIAQIARLHETELVIFNGCLSNRIASYVIRHGVKYVVYANIELPDSKAWQLMVGFYEFLKNGNSRNYVEAFIKTDSENGDYGLGFSPEYVLSLQVRISSLPLAPPSLGLVTRADLIKYTIAILFATAALTVAINFLAGIF